ncbi:MAG: hypothetical protein AB1916_10625 [Thermodesulfobacteriota bacterium]
MRRVSALLLLLALLLPCAAPASALPGPSWRRAEAPGATAARLAAQGLKRMAETGVLRLAGAEHPASRRSEARLAVSGGTLQPPSPQPVVLAAQRLMDLTARALAQVRDAPLHSPAVLAV